MGNMEFLGEAPILNQNQANTLFLYAFIAYGKIGNVRI